MEFWGVEVKPGEQLTVRPRWGKLIHISQAALGEVKDVKGANHVLLRLNVGVKSLVLGTLSAEERTQLMFGLVFEKKFELSHDWKNGSVYFIGYIADDPVSDEEDFSYEPKDALLTGNMKQNLWDVKDAKTGATIKAGNKKEGLPVSEDEDDSESDSVDEMTFIKSAEEGFSDDSEEDSEDDVDGTFASKEEEPPKAKKRPAGSAQKAPVLNKKAKTSTPNNTGNKIVHNAIPLP